MVIETLDINSLSAFDTMTQKYDSWYDSPEGKALYRSELICISSLVDNCRPPLLEIGAGTGRFIMHYPHSAGIDPAFNPLKMAKTRGADAVQAFGENLPFRNETFGCILIIFTLCFIENPIRVLNEATRVMKHDGSIILGVVPKDSPRGISYEEKKVKGSPFYTDARFYTFEEVKKLLREAGLTILKIKSTLIQKQGKTNIVEAPVEGYSQEAGFLCIEAKLYKE